MYVFNLSILFVFFMLKTAYVMRISDWISDVFSSDLLLRSDGAVSRRCLSDPAGDRDHLHSGCKLPGRTAACSLARHLSAPALARATRNRLIFSERNVLAPVPS